MSAPSISIHPAARTAEGLTDDARSILQRRVYAVVGTQNPDGSPHLAPVMFLFDGRRILVETGATTRKARNVASRGSASVLVQTPEVAWVLGTGPAQVVRGQDAVLQRTRIREKYLTAAGRAACDLLLDEMDDVTIVIEPTRWLSWDLTAFVDRLVSDGVDPSTADGWFLTDS